MEYLVSKGFRQVSDHSVARLRDAATFRPAAFPFVDHRDDFFLFSNAPPCNSSRGAGCYYLFDGHVFNRDDFLHPFLEPTAAQLDRVSEDLIERNWSEASGIFTLLHVNPRAQQFTVFTDPLSQYPVLTWQQGERYIVSNNALLVEAFLSERGYQLQRNPQCHLFGAETKMNFEGAAPFKGMHYLQPGFKLNGAQRIEKLRALSTGYLSTAPARYEEHIEQCAIRIKQRCNALIKCCPDYYFLTDITGGIDSRLVLAALMASGHENRIAPWCNTKYPHPDANIADHILYRYQLNGGALLHNWHGEWPDYEQKIRRGLFRNRGGRFKDWNALGTGYFPKMVRLGGALGEVGRCRFHAAGLADGSVRQSELSRHLCQRSLNNDEFSLLTEHSIAMMQQQFQKRLDRYYRAGIERSNYSSKLYLDTVSRYHFGHQSACCSMAYIAPTLLYDIHLVWANSCLNLAQQQAGKAQFDLMQALADKDLLRLPMANKRWPAEALPPALREEFSRIAIIDRNSARLPMKEESMQWQFCWPMGKAKLEPPATPAEWARGKSHAWLQLHKNQQLAQRLVFELNSDDEFFTYFDRKQLLALVQAEPESISKHSAVAGLSALVGGLMWHLGMEERVPLKDRYAGSYPS